MSDVIAFPIRSVANNQASADSSHLVYILQLLTEVINFSDNLQRRIDELTTLMHYAPDKEQEYVGELLCLVAELQQKIATIRNLYNRTKCDSA